MNERMKAAHSCCHSTVDGRVEVSLIMSAFSKHPSPQLIRLCHMGFLVTDHADDSSTAANVLSLNLMVVPIEASVVRVESFAA